MVGRPNEKDEIVDRKNYDIVIWNLRVRNSLPHVSHVAKDCSVIIDWDFIQDDSMLLWKTPRKEPEQCTISSNPILIEYPTPHYDNKYDNHLGTEYIFGLKSLGEESITIPQGAKRELYFLLTINGHDRAYPIMGIPRNSGYRTEPERQILVEHMNDIPLLLTFDDSYELGIRFECINYTEERNHRYKVEIQSYDNVHLSEI